MDWKNDQNWTEHNWKQLDFQLQLLHFEISCCQFSSTQWISKNHSKTSCNWLQPVFVMVYIKYNAYTKTYAYILIKQYDYE